MGVPAGLLIDENTTLKANGDGAHRIAETTRFTKREVYSGYLFAHFHRERDDPRSLSQKSLGSIHEDDNSTSPQKGDRRSVNNKGVNQF